jgi:serine/threonine-protein kinase
MTKRTFFCGFLILTSALAGTSLAWADPSPTDKAASDVLFKDAKQLVAAGHVNEACPKFEESERLDPTPGTLLNLGDCYKGASPPRTASAWGAYRQAEAMARQRGDAARQEGAALRAQALEPLLSKVTIVVPVAARVSGLVVKWDGRAVGEGLFGSAFPADAGEHKIEAEAPGKSNWTSTVRVQSNAETTVTTMPTLAVAPAGAAGDDGPRPFWNTARYVGAGIGAAGLVGVVVGSIFGIKAANKNSESLPHCLPNNSKRCDSQGVALGADALAAAKVSTLAFVIGGAALVGGTIVFLAAPAGAPQNKSGLRRIEAQSVVGLGFGGMTLRGEW